MKRQILVCIRCIPEASAQATQKPDSSVAPEENLMIPVENIDKNWGKPVGIVWNLWGKDRFRLRIAT